MGNSLGNKACKKVRKWDWTESELEPRCSFHRGLC